MRLVEELQARGHPNVLATHSMTFEITKDLELTRGGDCVIAVGATRGLHDFSSSFKRLCRNERTSIILELEAAGIVESILGRGSPALQLSDLRDIVGRKSAYVSDRTIMIRANKAASDLSRSLVRELKSSDTKVQVRISAEL